MKTNTDKFDALVSPEQSGWQVKAQERMHSGRWQDKAFDIALQVLRHIRTNRITQVQLAESMGVTPQYIHKILQGKENLTLETICKIESALSINIVEVVYSQTETYDIETTKVCLTDMLSTTSILKESVDLDSIGYENVLKQVA